MYDIAVIGAGINGCAIAYELHLEGKNVAVFDMNEIASGGSGAAGAFISPKFSKTGELKELINSAFLYSTAFYKNNFPEYFTQTQLLHIAKDEAESQTIKEYKLESDLELKTPSETLLNTLKPHAKSLENVSLISGVVDARNMCKALLQDIEFVQEKVTSLEFKDSSWQINEKYKAKEIVLATGAYEPILKEDYVAIRGIWGHRIDIETSTKNESAIHQEVSISPSKDGVVAIGATHDVHYHPQTSKEPYDIAKGREILLQRALKTIELEDVKVIKDYTGLRSGSVDYLPLLGELVISKDTLACGNIRFDTKRVDFAKYTYYPNLYMLNGNGGYGFVLAPYLAKMLAQHIVKKSKISERLSPARFFARYARRGKFK